MSSVKKLCFLVSLEEGNLESDSDLEFSSRVFFEILGVEDDLVFLLWVFFLFLLLLLLLLMFLVMLMLMLVLALKKTKNEDKEERIVIVNPSSFPRPAGLHDGEEPEDGYQQQQYPP